MRKNNITYKFPLAVLLLAHFVSALPGDTPFLGAIWFLWIAICSYYALLLCLEKKALIMNFFAILLLIFWAMNAISFFISPKQIFSFYLFLEVDTLVIFKSITIALFSYFPFYYFSEHGSFKENRLRTFVFLLFIFSFFNLLLGYTLQSQITLEDNNVVDQAYLFVQLIPLILISYKKSPLYIFIALAALLVLWGSKRGAILCMAIDMMVFFVYLLKEDSFGRKHRGVILMFFALVLVVGVMFVLGNDFLYERLLETGSDSDKSGDVRTERYLELWTVYLDNSSIEQLLFGRGFAQTVTVGGGLAHQDWIELLIDNGFFGLFLYIFMIGICVKNIIKWNSSVPKAFRYALICCVLNWSLTATYSMVYASREAFILFVTLGIINGYIQFEKKRCLQPR